MHASFAQVNRNFAGSLGLPLQPSNMSGSEEALLERIRSLEQEVKDLQARLESIQAHFLLHQISVAAAFEQLQPRSSRSRTPHRHRKRSVCEAEAGGP
jgi:hypothetical protein